jgi:hypothetical protein
VKLQGSYDAGIKDIKISVATLGGYCIRNTVPGTVQYHKSGPSGDIHVRLLLGEKGGHGLRGTRAFAS